MRFLTLLSLFILLLISACAPVAKTEYVILEVPVRCDIQPPSRPEKSADPLLTLVDVLAYTLKLEAALKACTLKKEGDNENR
jgi:hypothetical protein